jgi:hypothetical protein
MDPVERRVREIADGYGIEVPADAREAVALVESMIAVQQMIADGTNLLATARALDLEEWLARTAFALATEDASVRCLAELGQTGRRAKLTYRDGIALCQGVQAGVELGLAVRRLRST